MTIGIILLRPVVHNIAFMSINLESFRVLKL